MASQMEHTEVHEHEMEVFGEDILVSRERSVQVECIVLEEVREQVYAGPKHA